MRSTEILTEAKESWGYHLLLDCRGMNDNVEDEKIIKKFVKELVDRIDMIAVGDPLVKYFPPKPDPKSGWSIVQLIVTSTIVCHFMDQSREAYIDVFSCKKFEPGDAEAVVREFFEPEHIKSHFLNRQA